MFVTVVVSGKTEVNIFVTVEITVPITVIGSVCVAVKNDTDVSVVVDSIKDDFVTVTMDLSIFVDVTILVVFSVFVTYSVTLRRS